MSVLRSEQGSLKRIDFAGKKLNPFWISPTPSCCLMFVLLCCWWQLVLRFLHSTRPSFYIFNHPHLLEHIFYSVHQSINHRLDNHPLSSTAKKYKHDGWFTHLSNYRWSQGTIFHCFSLMTACLFLSSIVKDNVHPDVTAYYYCPFLGSRD